MALTVPGWGRTQVVVETQLCGLIVMYNSQTVQGHVNSFLYIRRAPVSLPVPHSPSPHQVESAAASADPAARHMQLADGPSTSRHPNPLPPLTFPGSTAPGSGARRAFAEATGTFPGEGHTRPVKRIKCPESTAAGGHEAPHRPVQGVLAAWSMQPPPPKPAGADGWQGSARPSSVPGDVPTDGAGGAGGESCSESVIDLNMVQSDNDSEATAAEIASRLTLSSSKPRPPLALPLLPPLSQPAHAPFIPGLESVRRNGHGGVRRGAGGGGRGRGRGGAQGAAGRAIGPGVGRGRGVARAIAMLSGNEIPTWPIDPARTLDPTALSEQVGGICVCGCVGVGPKVSTHV